MAGGELDRGTGVDVLLLSGILLQMLLLIFKSFGCRFPHFLKNEVDFLSFK